MQQFPVAVNELLGYNFTNWLNNIFCSSNVSSILTKKKGYFWHLLTNYSYLLTVIWESFPILAFCFLSYFSYYCRQVVRFREYWKIRVDVSHRNWYSEPKKQSQWKDGIMTSRRMQNLLRFQLYTVCIQRIFGCARHIFSGSAPAIYSCLHAKIALPK